MLCAMTRLACPAEAASLFIGRLVVKESAFFFFSQLLICSYRSKIELFQFEVAVSLCYLASREPACT